MNFPLLNAILQSDDLSCGQRMILTVLLNHGGTDGRIYPSQTTIGKQAGLCERAVRDHIQNLITDGWLSKNGRHYTVTKPAKYAGINGQEMPVLDPENRQNLPDSSNDDRQEMPPKPADSSDEPAKSAETTGKICRQTTQEPHNKNPRTKILVEPPPLKKSEGKGTQAELEAYAVEIGLPASDGASMFDHWSANGWRNGSSPSRDWKAGIRKWKSQGWLPSQKPPAKGQIANSTTTKPKDFSDWQSTDWITGHKGENI